TAEPALMAFRRAIALMPGHADAHASLGLALERLGRTDEAESAFRRALALKPGHADANNGLATLLRARGEASTAITLYQRAIETEPHHLRALDNLGDALHGAGGLDDARSMYRRADEVSPSFGRRLKAGLLLPRVYASLEEMNTQRARFFEALTQLERWRDRIVDPLAEINQLPFALAGQGENDRVGFERIANLVRPSVPEWVTPRTKAPRGKTRRVGYVLPHAAISERGASLTGVLPALAARGIEIIALDPNSAGAAPSIILGAARIVKLPRHLAAARHAIADLHLGALIHGEIGRDPLGYFLAFSRLAPAQLNLGGIGVTSGLRTIDHYISDRFTDDEAAQEEYTERLIRLDGFARLWSRPAAVFEARGRAALGLPPSGALYVCPVRPSRLHPAFDRCLAGILERDRDGHVVLLEDPLAPCDVEHLRARFQETLGRDAARVLFIVPSRLDAVLPHATVVLDAMPSGGIGALIDAFASHVPIVTWAGPVSRARRGRALYRALGVDGPVARDATSYVDQALALAGEPARRAALVEAIREHAPRLFDQPAGAEALADFVMESIAHAGGAR
ncbi:MAG: tetratricopeptide repeat protein, partial [Alphaproteobacteria bacterium]|nr:tetratricopeptide repeat protein [Alphaproteobacteria bacterium]